MKKEIIEIYKDRYCTLGVPHKTNPNSLFFHSGIITYLDDDVVTIQRANDVLTLELELIKSIRASGSTGAHGEY